MAVLEWRCLLFQRASSQKSLRSEGFRRSVSLAIGLPRASCAYSSGILDSSSGFQFGVALEAIVARIAGFKHRLSCGLLSDLSAVFNGRSPTLPRGAVAASKVGFQRVSRWSSSGTPARRSCSAKPPLAFLLVAMLQERRPRSRWP